MITVKNDGDKDGNGKTDRNAEGHPGCTKKNEAQLSGQPLFMGAVKGLAQMIPTPAGDCPKPHMTCNNPANGRGKGADDPPQITIWMHACQNCRQALIDFNRMVPHEYEPVSGADQVLAGED